MNGIYFSGTGNTKYCTEALTQATGGRACSMESGEALEVLRASDEIALGYPIYFSDIPRIVKTFIREHADMFCGKRVFIIATMGLSAETVRGLRPGCFENAELPLREAYTCVCRIVSPM
ncbi:MAG: flavodoxin family protein [Treponema socranskii subsp. buccale]